MKAFNSGVLYFFIFSFIGWFCESVYCSLLIDHKPVNRGFLAGPVCPIYGFGGLIVVYMLLPLKEDPLKLFFLAMLLTTILEYVTSILMEKLFNARWWDYSKQPLNLNGRVCLLNSLEFGVMSMAAVYWVYPPMAYIVTRMSVWTGGILSCLFLTVFVVDLFFSVRSAFALNSKLAELKVVADEILEKLELQKERLEKRLETITEMEEIRERLESLRQRAKTLQIRNASHRRLLKAFPGLQSKRYQEQLDELRAAVYQKVWHKNGNKDKENPQKGKNK